MTVLFLSPVTWTCGFGKQMRKTAVAILVCGFINYIMQQSTSSGYQPFVTDSYESGWKHIAGAASYTTLLLPRRYQSRSVTDKLRSTGCILYDMRLSLSSAESVRILLKLNLCAFMLSGVILYSCCWYFEGSWNRTGVLHWHWVLMSVTVVLESVLDMVNVLYRTE
jgi:hypothetical protein